MKEQNLKSSTEACKLVAQTWNLLSEREKSPFREMAGRDKEKKSQEVKRIQNDANLVET